MDVVLNIKTTRTFLICATTRMTSRFLPSGIFLLYDGIGGTIKREASYYSLKQPYSNQILTAKDLFNFAEKYV